MSDRLDLSGQITPDYNQQALKRVILAICGRLNQLSEGRQAANYGAMATVPTGTAAAYAVGDFIADSNCTMAGSIAPGVSSNYVRLGWICTTAGTPSGGAVFREVRIATGT